MKKLIVLFAAMAMISVFFSCQNQGKETTNEIAFQQVPNPSAIKFGEAVRAFQLKDMATASNALEVAILELKKEAARTDLDAAVRAKEEAAIAELEKMATAIREGKIHDLQLLQEAIINADAQVKHEYLVTTDKFLLVKPKTVRSKKINRAFDRSLKLLKIYRKDLRKDLQPEADALIKESDALLQKREELDASIYDEMKKLQDFIKKHRPAEEPVTYYPYL